MLEYLTQNGPGVEGLLGQPHAVKRLLEIPHTASGQRETNHPFNGRIPVGTRKRSENPDDQLRNARANMVMLPHVGKPEPVLQIQMLCNAFEAVQDQWVQKQERS
ncbi:hypothetical protein KC727_03170 [Candidatus Kaiserbacteria bacterium]|nr:hypothetical protein [Candidatus Kaiserbacteria bacterium]